MGDSQQDEQQALEKYLEDKAKQEQESQPQEAESLSEYEACVLRESDRVKELIAEARGEAKNSSDDD